MIYIKYYSVKSISEMLDGISEEFLKELIKEKKLKCVSFGDSIRVSEKQLRAYLANLEKEEYHPKTDPQLIENGLKFILNEIYNLSEEKKQGFNLKKILEDFVIEEPLLKNIEKEYISLIKRKIGRYFNLNVKNKIKGYTDIIILNKKDPGNLQAYALIDNKKSG